MVDSQPQLENTIFDSRLVESTDENPEDTEANCVLIEIYLCVSGPVQFKSMSFTGQLYIYILLVLLLWRNPTNTNATEQFSTKFVSRTLRSKGNY